MTAPSSASHGVQRHHPLRLGAGELAKIRLPGEADQRFAAWHDAKIFPDPALNEYKARRVCQGAKRRQVRRGKGIAGFGQGFVETCLTESAQAGIFPRLLTNGG